jgi:hypothetical protein
MLRWTLLAVLAALMGPAVGHAGDWMFRRSYYSHDDSPGYAGGSIPEPRSAYRPALVGAHPRMAIRGGYRINNIVILNGNSSDRVYYRENWFDAAY